MRMSMADLTIPNGDETSCRYKATGTQGNFPHRSSNSELCILKCLKHFKMVHREIESRKYVGHGNSVSGLMN